MGCRNREHMRWYSRAGLLSGTAGDLLAAGCVFSTEERSMWVKDGGAGNSISVSTYVYRNHKSTPMWNSGNITLCIPGVITMDRSEVGAKNLN